MAGKSARTKKIEELTILTESISNDLVILEGVIKEDMRESLQATHDFYQRQLRNLTKD